MPCSALCAECHLALTYVTISGTTDSQCIENRRVCTARQLLDGGGDGGGKGKLSQKVAPGSRYGWLSLPNPSHEPAHPAQPRPAGLDDTGFAQRPCCASIVR
jgi:hypothetical protein